MNKITWCIFICFALSLQSCFEIVEQVFMASNGSGNFLLTINLSKSKTKVNSILKMKTVNGHAVPSVADVKKQIIAAEKTVAKTPGLTGVKTSFDDDNYIATLSCNFSKLAQLNNIVKTVAVNSKTAPKYLEKSYIYNSSTNVFSRLNKISVKDDYNKMSNADKEIFATANYTAIYKFEQPITTATNKDAKISPSKKAILLSLNMLDIITNKKSIENNITISK